MINNSDNGFNKEDHLFVTPHRQVYEALGGEGNVVLDESKEHLVNKYAPKCEWIISHDLPGIKEALLTKRCYLKKIAWRTWGGGHQRYDYKKGSFWISLIHRIADLGYKWYLNTIFGKGVIGVANSVDIIDLRVWLKTTPLIPMPYIGSDQYPVLKEILLKPHKKSDRLQVLLGHQGTVAENHMALLYILKKFDSHKINITIPLSYGTKSYIEQLIPQIEALHMPNVTILTNFLSYAEYAKLLNSMDVAILDEPSSMALGNLSILLFFKKKLVLNRDGILRKVLLMNNIPHFCTDELPSITIEEILKSDSYDGEDNDIVLHDYPYYVNQWNNVFSFLEGRV